MQVLSTEQIDETVGVNVLVINHSCTVENPKIQRVYTKLKSVRTSDD